jgi:hypothetical protein
MVSAAVWLMESVPSTIANLYTAELKTFYSGNDKRCLISRETSRNAGSMVLLAPAKQLQATLFYISIHIPPFILDLVQVHSDEGLNVQCRYLGTVFFYQGFNDYCGWMHTSSNVLLICMPKIVRKRPTWIRW